MLDITFIKTEGGLGRVISQDDSVSGFIFSGNTPDLDDEQQNKVYYSQKEVEDEANFADDAFDVLKYHTKQFFKMVSAPLYIAIGDNTWIAKMQRASGGTIRQVAFLNDTTFAPTQVSALQTIADTLSGDHMGLSIIYGASITVAASSFPDLTTLTCPNVSVVVGKDTNADGYKTMLGLTLGAVALSKVSESISWVQKFNVVKGEDFDKLSFINDAEISTFTNTELKAVENKGYIFLKKHTGKAGSYFSNSNTATATSSDYAYIENVRTIEKAERGIRAALLPKLGSPLKLKAGKLSLQTITDFELLVENTLDAMVNAGELSEFGVFIDPTQNVLTTSKLEIQVVLVPLGIAREIVVKLGFGLIA